MKQSICLFDNPFMQDKEALSTMGGTFSLLVCIESINTPKKCNNQKCFHSCSIYNVDLTRSYFRRNFLN